MSKFPDINYSYSLDGFRCITTREEAFTYPEEEMGSERNKTAAFLSRESVKRKEGLIFTEWFGISVCGDNWHMTPPSNPIITGRGYELG